MKKKWELCDIDEEKVKEIANKFNVSELLATIIYNRKIINDKEIEIFLNPTRNDFNNPFDLPDIEKAVNRIVEAIDNKEKIIIYGDYDVDGITSTTVLKKFLEERGAFIVDYYIPNRLNEGYGLNLEAIKQIVKDEYSLMITVDCGISATAEIDFANSLGLNTVITDHHEPLEVLPNAIAVVDAKRADSKYPFRELAGVGVVFKLIQAISMKLNLDEKEYLKYLDIVCVGTISDIVPLMKENRVIAKLGLKLVEQTKNPGLKALLLETDFKKVNSNMISFGIAPRINACGRMGCEEEGLKLFLSNNLVEVQDITKNLNNYNKLRQETERKIIEEAIARIKEEHLDEKDIIVLGGENWHHGVIGIVASKITEMYYKPSILLCFDGDEAKGSGRSIAGFDLHDALCKSKEFLEKYGGHEMAVGLNMKAKNFEKFKEFIENIAKEANIKDAKQIIKIDKEISLKDMNKEVIEELKCLEPFGEGNKTPIFVYKNLRIEGIRTILDGKHLKLILRDDNTLINAIGFNIGNLVNEYLIGDKVDIAGVLEINEYKGISTIQINIKDIMKSY